MEAFANIWAAVANFKFASSQIQYYRSMVSIEATLQIATEYQDIIVFCCQ